jgi:hypothetical protein
VPEHTCARPSPSGSDTALKPADNPRAELPGPQVPRCAPSACDNSVMTTRTIN